MAESLGSSGGCCHSPPSPPPMIPFISSKQPLTPSNTHKFQTCINVCMYECIYTKYSVFLLYQRKQQQQKHFNEQIKAELWFYSNSEFFQKNFCWVSQTDWWEGSEIPRKLQNSCILLILLTLISCSDDNPDFNFVHTPIWQFWAHFFDFFDFGRIEEEFYECEIAGVFWGSLPSFPLSFFLLWLYYKHRNEPPPNSKP